MEEVSRSTVREAQDAVPADELILARMGQAYFLDFNRNPVWHLDIPGASSLPPGLPLGQNATSADLAAYFRKCGIRYIIYSEIDDGGHHVSLFLTRQESLNPWERFYSRNIVEFDRMIRGLKENAKVIYRKNGLVVFALQAKNDRKFKNDGR